LKKREVLTGQRLNELEINGIRLTIANDYPSNPQNNKEFFYHTAQRMLYVYTNDGWQMTGAALR